MTTTELATVEHGNALALNPDRPFWNDQQLAALRHMGVDKASNGDLAVFHHVCQRTGLDPFAKQIHMVGRNSKEWDPQTRSESWTTKYTIQTGIDGYRLVARRAADRRNEYLEYEDTLWCGRDGVWVDAWIRAEAPAAAKVVVLRNGKRFPATVTFAEYVQTTKKGDTNAMWSRMPANQLAKCAEALALRKAFPQDLSGIYTDDEMGQADNTHDRVRGEVVHQESNLAAALAAAETPVDPARASVDGDAAGGPEDSGPPAGDAKPITKRTRGQLFALFAQKGIAEDDQLSGINHLTGGTYTSRADITEADALAVIEVLKGRPDADAPMDAES